MAVVQIGEQTGLSGFPAEGLARDEAGRREGSIVTRFVKSPKYPGSIRTSAGTLTVGRPRRLPMASAISRNGMPSSCNRVPIFAGRTLLQRQAEHGGDIADVHGAPQVRAVSGVAGEALLLRERDQPWEEAGTIGRAVRDEREAARSKTALPARRGRLRRVPRRYEPAGCPCAPRRWEGPGPPRWPAGPGSRASRCCPPRPAAFRFPRVPRRRRA